MLDVHILRDYHCSMLLQRYRIGPNFRFVEVNRPRCPVHSSAEDGPLNVANQTGEINYFPSEFANQVCMHSTWTAFVLCLGLALIPSAAPSAIDFCNVHIPGPACKGDPYTESLLLLGCCLTSVTWSTQ